MQEKRVRQLMRTIRSYALEQQYHITANEQSMQLTANGAQGASFLVKRINAGSAEKPNYYLTVSHSDNGVAQHSIRCLSHAVHFCAGTLRNASELVARRREV